MINLDEIEVIKGEGLTVAVVIKVRGFGRYVVSAEPSKVRSLAERLQAACDDIER